jgi:hypothetical protein
MMKQAATEAPLAAFFRLISCLACSSNLKMEGASSANTSGDFQRIARSYILEDTTVQSLVCSPFNVSSRKLIEFYRWASSLLSRSPQKTACLRVIAERGVAAGKPKEKKSWELQISTRKNINPRACHKKWLHCRESLP